MKVGSEVILCSSMRTTVATITRETNTQWLVGNTRFRKKDGFAVGGTNWYRSFIREPKEGEIEKIRLGELLHSLRNRVRSLSVKDLSAEQCEKILEIAGNS